MRAAVMRNQTLVVDTVPEPEPAQGQVLVKTLACGICGSDLHVLKHSGRGVASPNPADEVFGMDSSRDLIMGHEFCAEIVDHGPGCQKTLPVGTRICSVPVAVGPGGAASVGFSNSVPGGYGELMVLTEAMLLPVPNGLSTEGAALTEPVAVGVHAVEKANIGAEDVPMVIGCGPVGLAVIAALKLKGAAPIIAADYSPARRRLAQTLGAEIVVDPAESSPYETWTQAAMPEGGSAAPGPFPGLAPALRPAVLFECVGVPGVIQQMLAGAAPGARVVVVGVCMETDTIEPLSAITKELNLQFVIAYSPEEFAATLGHIAEGRVPTEPLITGKVGVGGVAGAFEELANPEKHAKILVEPWRD